MCAPTEPPALAEAVARSIVEQDAKARSQARSQELLPLDALIRSAVPDVAEPGPRIEEHW